MPYQPVIGLEIHVQLKTKSKMFCTCPNNPDEAEPNVNICSICTGQPGTLPVINKAALEMAVLAARALNLKLSEESKFDRKNYFYPDLPKGYQISQYDMPIGLDGYLEIDVPSHLSGESNRAARGGVRPKGARAKIGITRVHLEEDAAKSIHGSKTGETLIDYNRCGTPLVEIVTEPDFRTPQEAKIFLQELRAIMRCLKISDADMEKAQMRCDANISLRKTDENGEFVDAALSPKTEIKNLNSFKAVERALEYEIKRQTKLWEQGKPPRVQSTRGWNEQSAVTEEQRVKEEAHDYRYFPEPDLPPMDMGEIIAKTQSELPELPIAKRKRFIDEYGFKNEEAKFLTSDPSLAEFTENVISELKEWLASLPEVEGDAEEIYEKQKAKLAKLVGGWICSKLQGIMTDKKIDIKNLKITPENFAEFISLIYTNKIGSAAAQKILAKMAEAGQDPTQIMEDNELGQMSDVKEIETVVQDIIIQNPDQAAAYGAGKTALLQFFVGLAMKATEGKADPNIVKVLLEKYLKEK
ncbi:Asp-tRNA(Asn)/Glu-tRNA(Gln) amidotransferase subunit GatB [Patescibacteria group bacterium]|nr:Asp-tRNA(Asn)/Glu-tRNA(Gln) amidotransferase subunit GatB [Patescibacteria group bacterium]